MTYLTVRKNRDNFNRMVDRFFDDWFTTPSYDSSFSPKVNIRETKDNVVLTFEVPGMKKDDIKVTVNNDVLTISGKRQFEHEEKDDVFVRREIAGGEFSRSFTLPDTVDGENIQADYKNGLLEVRLARREETKPKEIEVKIS
jgi:HSP20 family protein